MLTCTNVTDVDLAGSALLVGENWVLLTIVFSAELHSYGLGSLSSEPTEYPVDKFTHATNNPQSLLLLLVFAFGLLHFTVFLVLLFDLRLRLVLVDLNHVLIA